MGENLKGTITAFNTYHTDAYAIALKHGFEGTEAGYGPFQLIGAKNLADTTGQTGAFNIDLEQVLSWDPDIIFVEI